MRHLFCWLACLCFMAMPTMADKYFTIGDYRYFETDSIQKNVSVFSNSIDLEEIVIPEKVEYEGIEYNVTSIYPQAYMDHTEIKSVVIPSSVKSINYQAFHGCTNLTSVTIPKTVNFIGPIAFRGCSLLTSFDIPDSLKIIYEYTFKDCIRLVDASIPKSVTEIKSYAFHNCKLSSVTIPDSVTRIETSAFNGCQLSSVVVPKTVTYIGDGAFYGTDTLYYEGTSTGSPWGAKLRWTYDDGDFAYADKEKEYLFKYMGTDTAVTIPNNVKFIGDRAFQGNETLKSVTIPNAVTIIGEYAFSNCKKLSSINIPNSVKTIRKNAFANCERLTSINIPNSVTSLEEYAFSNCSGLTEVTISNSITTINNYTFRSCVGLTSITIPNSVKYINSSAFEGCTGLKSVEIPESVTSIGDHAFDGCRGVSSIVIPSSVTSIGFHALTGIDTLFYNGPANVHEWGESRHIRGNVFDGDFVYANKEKTILAYYLGSDSSVIIPDNVERIQTIAFSGNAKLKNVSIPNSVTTIERYSFSYCEGLTYIKVPNSVTGIEQNAFYNDNIIIYDGIFQEGSPWGAKIHIREAFFDGDFVYSDEQKENLAAYIGENTVISIPNQVKSIGDKVFQNKNITSVKFPDSITSIGKNAFYGCSFYYISLPESVTEIGGYAFTGTNLVLYKGDATGSPWGANRHIRVSVINGDFVYEDEEMTKLIAYIGTDSIVTIPNSVTSIYVRTFNRFQTVYYGGAATGSPWGANRHIKGTIFDGDFVYADEAKTNLVAYLGKNANVIISNSVTSIDANTFNGFETVYYGGTATGSPWGANRHIKGTIFDGDFVYADEAKTNLVAYLGKNANVIISNSVTSIDANTFNGFETVYYGGTATGSPWGAKRHIKGTIFDGDFVYADEAKTNLVAYLGKNANVIISNSVTSIDANTFNGFETVYYGGTATGSPWGAKRHIKCIISDGDFVYADEEKTELIAYTGTDSIVTIPETVTSIGANTFHGFETVYYAGTVTGSPWGAKRHIKGTIFDGDFVYADEAKTNLVAYLGKNAIVIIPNSVTSIDAKTFNGFETVYYGGSATGSPWGAKRHIKGYIDGDYIYVDEGKTKIAAYTGSDSVVVIPEQVKTIGDNVFNGNTKLISVILPDSIISIGDNAFSGCTGISSLTIPVSVTSIGKDAFSGIDTIYYQTENGTILIIKDFYVIHNLQEFLTYRDINNKGYHLNGRLDADIDLSPVCGIINGEIVNWETINLGDAMFDGGNHTITNLYINRSGYYIALLNGKHIENLTVKNAYVKGTDAAGITSCTSPLLLVNCHFEGVVIGTDFACGLNLYGKASTLVNCSNYGLVVGGKNAAADGIYAQEPINCYNRGRIVSNESTAKGVGMYCCCNPTNCYNAGAIISTEAYSIYEAYKSCFNLKIEGINLHDEETVQEMDSSAFLSGAVTDSLNKYVAQNPKTYDWWTIKDSIPLLPWVQGEDGFPRFEGVNLQPTQGYIVRFTGKVNNIDVSFDGTIDLPVCPVDGCTYVFSNDFDGKNIVSDTTVAVSQITDPNFLERDDDGFYLIHNGAELAKFRDVVNEGAVAINGRLANDIDLSQECKDSVWIPIGVYKNEREYIHMAYEGVFDGAGHSIEHLYNTITSSGYEGNSYKGLFAYTKNATIKNVAVKNSSLTAYFVAAIVAVAENTTIVNCGSEAKLYGPSDHGAAPICAISEGCRILNCYNIGDVKCEYNALGFTNGGEEIINCYTSCVVLYEGGSSSRFGDGRVVYRCFADTVLSSGKYNYDNKLVTMTSTEHIKSDAFLADMNAWVDSMNAAQSEFVFAHWVRDEVDGYPKLQPTHTSSSLPDVRRATPDGISVYAVGGTIYIRSAHAGEATLYDIHGRAVASVAYKEGLTTVDGLREGVYIVCGVKVIVRRGK